MNPYQSPECPPHVPPPAERAVALVDMFLRGVFLACMVAIVACSVAAPVVAVKAFRLGLWFPGLCMCGVTVVSAWLAVQLWGEYWSLRREAKPWT